MGSQLGSLQLPFISLRGMFMAARGILQAVITLTRLFGFRGHFPCLVIRWSWLLIKRVEVVQQGEEVESGVIFWYAELMAPHRGASPRPSSSASLPK